MPFFDNTGIDPEIQRGPLWGSFATLFEQLERLIALNLAWSAQFIPLLLVAMLPEWPLAVRVALIIYSALALAAGLGLLFGLVRAAVAGEILTFDLVRETWRELALPGILTLAPLYGIFGVIISLSALDLGLLVETGAQLTVMLLFVGSMYWGPLLAENPRASAIQILRQSVRLVARKPGQSLLVAGLVVITLLIGTISIGGLFLLVPVLVALLQTHMYKAISH